MSTYVYSIWTHQLETGDYYAYCPQFPTYYSTAGGPLDAVVRLSDLILSIVNIYIKEEIQIPSSEYFDDIPVDLLESLQSPTVLLMPIRIEDGIKNKSPLILRTLVEDKKLIPLPLEILELPEVVEDHVSTNPELIGFNLPQLELLQCDVLRREIEEITTSYNPGYKIGSVISGREENEEFLKYVYETVLEKLHNLVHEYSTRVLLTYFIPQLDLLHYFYGRDNNELKRKAVVQYFSKVHKIYAATKSTNRSVHSLGLRFLIDYIVAERPSGNRRELEPEIYDKMLALGFLYIHTRGVHDRLHHIKSADKIVISSQGFSESEPNLSDDWFMQYNIATIDNEMEIIEENTYTLPHLILNENDRIKLERKSEKYIVTESEMSDALMEEFGVNLEDMKIFDKLLSGVISCRDGTYNTVLSCCSVPRETLISVFLKHHNWNRTKVEQLLQLFTLPQRQGWNDIPDGYSEDDNDPNNPSARLSIQTKPIIQIDDILLWGWRYRSRMYLSFAKHLENGRVPHKKPKMQAVNSKIANYNSTIFRESVYRWFMINYHEPQYHVEEDEIRLKKLYKDAGDLGDIDVAVCDLEHNILYSIECKHNTHPRKPKDMRNEFDRYGVIEGKNEYLVKHKRRHDNMCQKPEVMKKRLGFTENPKIVSLHITEDITMVQHTGATEIPIFAYKDLIRNEKDILLEAKKHPFNNN